GHGRVSRYLSLTWDPDRGTTRTPSTTRLPGARPRWIDARRERPSVEGLFSREQWLRALSDAGFELRVVPFNHSELEPGRYEVFVAVRPESRARSARRVHLRDAAGHVVAGHRARSVVVPVPAVDRRDRPSQVI